MSSPSVFSLSLPDLPLWDRMKARRAVLSFELDITARCNNDCRHCYTNVPAGDPTAREAELSAEALEGIARQAADLGAVWCLISGGEPLIREDFPDLYLRLKRLGLLVSVFTNACLVTPAHVDLLRRYPPRDVEVSVYGATPETYERVTRRPGSFAAFRRGLDHLLSAGVPVRLKAMALRSNAHELPRIAAFCRERTRDFFRFDPQLHLRYDADPHRNEEIRAERLSPEEIVALEQADPERLQALQRSCDKLVPADCREATCDHLFHCGAGRGSFSVSPDGRFCVCASLRHPDCTADLRTTSVAEAWRELVPRVRAMRSDDPDFLQRCRRCNLINLCLWCPAHAYLETGRLDAPVDAFCATAHARATAILADPD
jgi:radical SAM protein with 4Fe4S-binding SPASM domain